MCLWKNPLSITLTPATSFFRFILRNPWKRKPLSIKMKNPWAQTFKNSLTFFNVKKQKREKIFYCDYLGLKKHSESNNDIIFLTSLLFAYRFKNFFKAFFLNSKGNLIKMENIVLLIFHISFISFWKREMQRQRSFSIN